MDNTQETLALQIINDSLKLPFVKVDRNEFLTKIFDKEIEDKNLLLADVPRELFIKDILDTSAQVCIINITTQLTLV